MTDWVKSGGTRKTEAMEVTYNSAERLLTVSETLFGALSFIKLLEFLNFIISEMSWSVSAETRM